MNSIHNKNIILNQIISNELSFSLVEIIPEYHPSSKLQSLTRDRNGNIFWIDIDLSLNVIVNNKIKDTNIYYDKGRIGLGRTPLFNYQLDLAIPVNKLMTGFHIGDGSFGFSLGNGTNQGFLPEIIGIGSNETDAGLYFVGIAGNNMSSNIPLIVFDGRNTYNDKLTNRPILGVTSGNYKEYLMLIDSSNNMHIKGNISTPDIILNNTSLINIIRDLQKQIHDLKTKIT